MKDFSIYSNAHPSDSMQAWALGRILFTAVMIRSLLRLATYPSTVLTSFEMEFRRLKMEELGFSSTASPTVSMFYSIISVRGGPGSLERDITGDHKSVDNSGEGVNVRKPTW